MTRALTPTLPNWDFYEFYGMVKNMKSNYEWLPKSGHDGGKAIAFCQGRYPEMKTIVDLEKGRRYTLSFWYKTEKRDRKSSFSIYYHTGKLTTVRGMNNKKLSRFVLLRLEPTDGKWKHIHRTIRAPYEGNYVLMLESFYQNALTIDVNEPFGPPHALESSAPRPFESSAAQGTAHLPVLNHVKVVEKGGPRLVWIIPVVAGVVEHRETAHHLVPLQRYEEGSLRVLIEGVVVRVELGAYLVDEGRHP